MKIGVDTAEMVDDTTIVTSDVGHLMKNVTANMVVVQIVIVDVPADLLLQMIDTDAVNNLPLTMSSPAFPL